MTIKLDENLPERLVGALTGLGHDVDTVRAEHLSGRDDGDVWSAAQAAGRFLITQDLDFSDVRRYAPGTHLGLLFDAPRPPGTGGTPRAGHDDLLYRTGRDVERLPRGGNRAQDSPQAALSIVQARTKNPEMKAAAYLASISTPQCPKGYTASVFLAGNGPPYLRSGCMTPPTWPSGEPAWPKQACLVRSLRRRSGRRLCGLAR